MARGNKYVKINDRELQRLIRTHPQQADDAIGATAYEGERYIKQSFNTSPPGETYQLYNPRRTHTASQDGFPPNVDTGKYRNSWQAGRLSQNHWQVATDDEKGPHLEFGTSNMGARPHVEPAANWLEKQIPRIFRNFLD